MITTILAIIGLLVALTIMALIRRDKLHVRHGLGWIIVAVAFALLGFAPGIIDWVALRLGIAYPPILAVIVAFAAMVLKILIMDIEVSRLERRNQRMIQRVAMLEAELRDKGPAG